MNLRPYDEPSDGMGEELDIELVEVPDPRPNALEILIAADDFLEALGGPARHVPAALANECRRVTLEQAERRRRYREICMYQRRKVRDELDRARRALQWLVQIGARADARAPIEADIRQLEERLEELAIMRPRPPA